jgi:predicted transposase YdaD
MSGFWDTICKVFVRNYPDALLRLFDTSATFVGARPTEIKEVERRMDSLLEVVSHHQPMLLHVEFQTNNDTNMAERLLEYNVITRRQQKLPVLSCVLYLLPHDSVPTSPLRWNVPGRTDILTFAFESIQASQLMPQDLIGMDSVELLTLLPLTHDGARQEMLEYMLQALRQNGDPELEVIGLAFASLAVREDEITTNWLKKRFQAMEDTFGDIPLFQDIKDKAFNEGEQRGEQRGALNSSREIIISLITYRFPALLPLAQQQIALIEDPHILQEMVLHISLADTEERARQELLGGHK